ncbi:MAG: hypothetical protein R2911_36275 [Caldilineaceae bacterium]
MKTTTLDLSDPLIQADPYPHYAQLRQEAPVCWNGRTWLISRYADIVALLSDPHVSARTEQTLLCCRPKCSRVDAATHHFGQPHVVERSGPNTRA